MSLSSYQRRKGACEKARHSHDKDFGLPHTVTDTEKRRAARRREIGRRRIEKEAGRDE